MAAVGVKNRRQITMKMVGGGDCYVGENGKKQLSEVVQRFLLRGQESSAPRESSQNRWRGMFTVLSLRGRKSRWCFSAEI